MWVGHIAPLYARWPAPWFTLLPTEGHFRPAQRFLGAASPSSPIVKGHRAEVAVASRFGQLSGRDFLCKWMAVATADRPDPDILLTGPLPPGQMGSSDFLSLCQRSGIKNGDYHVGIFTEAVEA